MEPDKNVIKSYVWHGDKCFFVSTIERDSSSMIGLDRYNETIVWEFDRDNNEMGEIVSSRGDSKGSLRAHFNVCALLHETGSAERQEEE